MEPWRRQQEQLRRALEGPLAGVVRQQAAFREAISGPLEQVARNQAAWRRSMEGPVLAAAAQQRAINEALRGPSEAAAQTQEQVRRALEGPFEAIRRNQEAINRALATPYASLLEQQRWLLDAAAKAAAPNGLAFEDLEAAEGDAPGAQWVRDFAAAMREAAPSKEQIEILLTHLSFLLALVATSVGLQDGVADPAELLSIVSTLFAACALLIWHLRR